MNSHDSSKGRTLTAGGGPRWLRIMGGACLLVVLAGSVHAANLFRYKDENGQLVLSHTIPSDRVKYGYDIVDSYGTLVQSIAPQLSEREYQAKLAREKRTKQCKKMRERVRKLYQFESDIDYAEEKGLESIDQAIANIRANLSVATTQRQEFEAQAAQMDIAGKRIPNMLLDNIERAKNQEKTFTEEIEKRFGDKLKLRKTHAYDRQIFLLESCDEGLPPQEVLASSK